MPRKKSKFARSRSRCGSFGSMLIALRSATSLLFAGQTSTQTPQPVQSSGATWIVHLHARELLALGTPSRLEPLRAPAQRRRVEDLHPDRGVGADQRAQSALDADARDPRSGCPGRCCASRTCVVPVGNVPSTGIALTGSKSPRLAMIVPSTSLDELGRIARHRRQLMPACEVTLLGHLDLVQRAERPVDGREVPLEHRLAPLAVGLLDRVLDLGDRFLPRQHARPA